MHAFATWLADRSTEGREDEEEEEEESIDASVPEEDPRYGVAIVFVLVCVLCFCVDCNAVDLLLLHNGISPVACEMTRRAQTWYRLFTGPHVADKTISHYFLEYYFQTIRLIEYYL